VAIRLQDFWWKLRGARRLGRDGIPNVDSAALIVLGDVNDERMVLPTTNTKTAVVKDKGEVQIVQSMAEPFKLEGLWGGP